MKDILLFSLRSLAATLFFVLLMPFALFAQGAWTTESSTGFTARWALTSSEVNGKIYVIGGYPNDGPPVNTLEVFDPLTKTWSTPTTTGTSTARAELVSSVVGGKIYVFGVAANQVKTLKIFDPSNNDWSIPTTTGTFTDRLLATASVVNGKIYLMGGYYNGESVNSIEVFDPATNAWSTLTTTGTFTTRTGASSCVIDGKIYVMGGIVLHTPAALNTLEVFDPATNVWSTPSTTGTFTPRSVFASSVIGGKIFVMGGETSDAGMIGMLEMFDPATNTWSTPATAGTFTPRGWLTASVVDNKIYAIGGVDANYTALNANEVFTLGTTAVEPGLASVRTIESFPNPVEQLVTLNGVPENTSHIIVLNLLGEQVLEIREPPSGEYTLDLRGLPPGSYGVRIESPGSIVTKMIVRQ